MPGLITPAFFMENSSALNSPNEKGNCGAAKTKQ
jgi:hypothetical protein